MCILPAGALQAEQLISILNPEQVANELAKKAKQQKKEKSRTRRRARHRADPEAAARAAALEAAQNEKRLVLEADIKNRSCTRSAYKIHVYFFWHMSYGGMCHTC